MYGFASNGGIDTATLDASAGNDLAYGIRGYSVLADSGLSQYLLVSVGFGSVVINGNGGDDFDLAVFYDSIDDDTLAVNAQGALLSSPNYQVEINNFDFYYALVSSGGINEATLLDSPGQDVIIAESIPNGTPGSLDRLYYFTGGVVFDLINWSQVTAIDSGTDDDVDLISDRGFDFDLILEGRWKPGVI